MHSLFEGIGYICIYHSEKSRNQRSVLHLTSSVYSYLFHTRHWKEVSLT